MSGTYISRLVLAYPDWGAPGNGFGEFLLVGFGILVFSGFAVMTVIMVIAANAKRKGNPRSPEETRP